MLISDVIRHWATASPARTALSDGSRTMSFAALYERCCRVANAVARLGGPGDRVAILADNNPEYMEAYYGVPLSGRILVMLNPRLHPSEWKWQLEDAGAVAVIVEDAFAEALASVIDPGQIEVLRFRAGDPESSTPYESALAAASATDPTVRPSPSDTAWIMYTSGTTGRPKGAELSHTALMAASIEMSWTRAFEVTSRYLLSFSMAHVSGAMAIVAHIPGGEVHLIPRFDVDQWLQTIRTARITHTGLAPTMMRYVLEAGVDPAHLTSVTSLAHGSAPMPVDLLREFLDRYGTVVSTGFGMTECAGAALWLTSDEVAHALAHDQELLGSCGRPMMLADAAILDDAGEPVAPGAVGELCIRGDQTLSRYWRNPEGTAAAKSGEWLRTGDIARTRDGYVFIVDRKKDMVVTGGENVSAREVEILLREHPDVADVAVIGAPDVRWGEQVVAVVVPRAGARLDAAEVVRFARTAMAGFKVPKAVAFLDELPLNSMSKVDKALLRTRCAEGTL